MLWYLAYGSNMSTGKFIGDRGIQPYETARVQLPGWILSMDIPGLPYSEPAFSSIRRGKNAFEAKVPRVIGVAYLISEEQYLTVLSSEGGGTAYTDISVIAEPLTNHDKAKTGARLCVRTLGTAMCRHPRARPSERYMNLIKTGAQEAKLPLEYLDFIDSIPVYHPSTNSFRKTGAMIFVAVWGPVMILLERLVRATVQSNGYAPRSVISLVRLTMKIIWLAHDLVFAPIFGRGDGLDDA